MHSPKMKRILVDMFLCCSPGLIMMISLVFFKISACGAFAPSHDFKCANRPKINCAFSSERNLVIFTKSFENDTEIEGPKIETRNSISTSSIHLISLPPLTESSSKMTRDIWKWKDIVLGDGRDFFVPRPRALKSLSDIVVGSSCGNYVVQECAILSNCARLDILIALSRDENEKHDGDTSCEHTKVAKSIISSCLNAQLLSFQTQRSKRGVFIEGVSSFFDLPGMIDASANGKDLDSLTFDTVESSLSSESEIHAITRHFCFVAAGLAPRSSRPDRPVLFRPFSSRDAHIMLQLKRTAEVASVYPQMKIVLDSALSAGKGARDPKQCPALLRLKGFDGEGKYSQAAPPQLAKEVTDVVISSVVEPAVERSIERIKAFKASSTITSLRQQAAQLCKDSDEEAGKIVRALLHTPTMKARGGGDVDIQQVLDRIKLELSNRQR